MKLAPKKRDLAGKLVHLTSEVLVAKPRNAIIIEKKIINLFSFLYQRRFVKLGRKRSDSNETRTGYLLHICRDHTRAFKYQICCNHTCRDFKYEEPECLFFVLEAWIPFEALKLFKAGSSRNADGKLQLVLSPSGLTIGKNNFSSTHVYSCFSLLIYCIWFNYKQFNTCSHQLIYMHEWEMGISELENFFLAVTNLEGKEQIQIQKHMFRYLL